MKEEEVEREEVPVITEDVEVDLINKNEEIERRKQENEEKQLEREVYELEGGDIPPLVYVARESKFLLFLVFFR